MASFVANIALGRVVELHRRVTSNDPANSALVVIALATTGLESDAILRDKATLTALVAGSTNEVTNTGYARKVLTNSELTAATVDNTNDRFDVDIPDLTWTGVGAGDGWSKIVVCYDDDTTGGTDANLIPLTVHDFVITPDGSDIVCVIPATGFYRATPL